MATSRVRADWERFFTLPPHDLTILRLHVRSTLRLLRLSCLSSVAACNRVGLNPMSELSVGQSNEPPLASYISSVPGPTVWAARWRDTVRSLCAEGFSMNSHKLLLGACFALSLVAVGCGSPGPVVSSDDFRRRPNEMVYEVPIRSVHAVVGPEERRCWIERQQVQTAPNVGGAIVGAVVGGIIGHQIGAGRGRDVATVGGAVVGGAVGANAGRTPVSREVERCETVANTTPDYWDITYDFRGEEHHVQMTYPPGATITVNRFGEPRV
jgi:uncharacterized protein YcfJ